jgi:hypothetical protein
VAVEKCCYRCDKPTRGVHAWFNVCLECGNKHCPKGTWHGYDCTNSNEPNQPGSRYAVGAPETSAGIYQPPKPPTAD